MDSNDGEYEDNDGQSEVSEEEEDKENGENDEYVVTNLTKQGRFHMTNGY